MTHRNFLAIVLAAGLGTRMRSSLPKVMHPIGNLPMVGHVLKALSKVDANHVAVVVGPEMPEVESLVGSLTQSSSCHVQEKRLGTAHAALAAAEHIGPEYDDVLVLFGDTPLVTAETISRVSAGLAAGSDLVVLGFEAEDPFGYGRLLTDGDQLRAIREEKDATDSERKVTLCNSGIMGFRGDVATGLINSIGSDNAKGEYYLTDAVEIANARGLRVTVELADEAEVQGINTRTQLAECEAVFQGRTRRAVMEAGVTLQAPDTVFFSHDTVVEPDVVIEPNVVFGEGVTIRSGALIKAFCHMEKAVIGVNAKVGPYGRLRPGAELGEGAVIGNFVEVKNSQIGDGSKVNHLSYIGDADVGPKSNIGAGTITCNYDGFLKYRTTIGAGVFVGSNSTLVAPVTLGDRTYIGAGSVVTEGADADALVLGRARQVVKEGRGAEIRARLAKAKADKQRGF